jgi:hypothetical protein
LYTTSTCASWQMTQQMNFVSVPWVQFNLL